MLTATLSYCSSTAFKPSIIAFVLQYMITLPFLPNISLFNQNVKVMMACLQADVASLKVVGHIATPIFVLAVVDRMMTGLEIQVFSINSGTILGVIEADTRYDGTPNALAPLTLFMTSRYPSAVTISCASSHITHRCISVSCHSYPLTKRFPDLISSAQRRKLPDNRDSTITIITPLVTPPTDGISPLASHTHTSAPTSSADR